MRYFTRPQHASTSKSYVKPATISISDQEILSAVRTQQPQKNLAGLLVTSASLTKIRPYDLAAASWKSKTEIGDV